METKQNIIGTIGFGLIFFGMCLADSESMVPTLICMGFGIIMLLPLLKEK